VGQPHLIGLSRKVADVVNGKRSLPMLHFADATMLTSKIASVVILKLENGNAFPPLDLFSISGDLLIDVGLGTSQRFSLVHFD
jgi:hypothetical protein